jgi:hypothetical protein
MQSTTLLLIIGAAILALGFAAFQYFYKARFKTRRNKVYALLRFLTVFGLLVLLINPKYKQVGYYTEKPSLAVAIDNTISMDHLKGKDAVQDVYARFRESEVLQKAFDVQYFEFDSEVRPMDSLDFKGSQTNVSSVLKSLQSIYKDETAPTVLITDGNQTLGEGYVYAAKNYKNPIYPLVVGDTLRYDDLKIGQVNVNRYAYFNNKFPIEIFANYNGSNNINSRLVIRSGGKTVHQENVQFSSESRSKVFNVLLPAEAVGVLQYSITLTPIAAEKNVTNNHRNFAIEVIDQKTKVAIVSDVVHPDIGALKKSIESNRLRTVTLLQPADAFGKLNDFQLVILYQPTRNFETLFTELDVLGKNNITITGKETDWRFLNEAQTVVKKELTGQSEEVLAVYNRNFSSFLIEDFGFDDLPPLMSAFGELTVNGEADIALYQRIGSVETEDPLLLTSDQNGRRGVYLFGAGLWRWRAQSYLDARSFESFDNFIDKLVQYAASDKKKSRLNIDYDSFYYGNGDVKLYAQYFDKNYVFDARASINIKVTDKETTEVYQAPFLLQKTGYQIDLSNLKPGEYRFTVTVDEQGLARSGSFTIIPFDVEKQFLNAAIQPLREIAVSSKGGLFTIDLADTLIQELVTDGRYRPIQKSNENSVPLVDWKWLLAVLAGLLAIEWFMRKYNGLT